jgi:hypothetical protein
MSAWWATWNYNQFSYNAYNELENPWTCIKKGSIYTNPYSTIQYFSKDCLDPYTSYAYHYKRGQFADPTQYLNCYFLPYSDPFFKNAYGYIEPGNKCRRTGKRDGWNVTDGGFHFYE